MTEDIAAPQHDNERHQQESRDGCQSDEQKEAWQRNKGKESLKKYVYNLSHTLLEYSVQKLLINNWLFMG